jgi:hypothetical protein
MRCPFACPLASSRRRRPPLLGCGFLALSDATPLAVHEGVLPGGRP